MKESKQLLAQAKTATLAIEWDRARTLYERVARGKFLRARGYLGLADVAFQTKDLEEAENKARRALRAGAGVPARLLLGHVHFKRGNYEAALQDYEAVLKQQPANEEARSSLQAARHRLGVDANERAP